MKKDLFLSKMSPTVSDISYIPGFILDHSEPEFILEFQANIQAPISGASINNDHLKIIHSLLAERCQKLSQIFCLIQIGSHNADHTKSLPCVEQKHNEIRKMYISPGLRPFFLFTKMYKKGLIF